MRSKTFMFNCLLLSLLMASIPVTSYCLSWRSDLPGGLKESGSRGSPVMADFYADWCVWCKKLDKETYSDPKVQALAQGFICVKVNGDKFPDLVSRYLITGYPTVVFFDPEGKEISRIAGYTDAGGLLTRMEEIASKYPGARTGIAQPGKTSASGWKAAFTDFWYKFTGHGPKKEQETRSSAPGVPVYKAEERVSATPVREAQSAPVILAVPEPAEKTSPVSENAVVYSDLIIMKSGNSIQGVIKDEKSDSYVVKLPFGEVTLKKTDVKEIKRLPPEEACFNLGNRFLESHNFDAAIAEYNKALKIDPGYIPAKDAVSAAKKKKLEYGSQIKALVKQEAEDREKDKQAESAAVGGRSPVKEISYFISISDMNIPIKKGYSFTDFGFTVDGGLTINSFAQPPEVFPGKGRVRTVNSSPAEFAGVRLGDRLSTINGRSIAGLSPVDAEKLIGSHRYIKLTVERQ